jgi:dihydroflavonol-4-reductase
VDQGAPATAHAREVFLTGATGFIGSRLAKALIGRGDRLRCLVRDTAAARWLERLGARLIQGDITDDIALQYGLRGADIGYHLAGLYELGVTDHAAMERVNVDGTRAFLLVGESAGVPKLVHVSSSAALGPTPDGESNATREYDGPYPSVYHRTKAHAHRLARRAQERGQPVIIVCPSNVYGPGDHGPNARFIADLVRGRMPGLMAEPGSYSYVHVDDVVSGLLAAGDVGRPGETYILSGEPLSINEFAERVAAEAGVPAPKLRLPTGLVRAGGAALDLLARLTGARFAITREGVDTSAQRWLHGHAKATEALGWKPRTVSEGLPETVAWFRERGASRGGGRGD